MKQKSAFLLALIIPVFSSCVAPEQGGTTAAPHKNHAQAVREELPATGPVPQYVIDDCFAELKKLVGDKKMKLISATRGEATYIVDIQVEGAQKPWRAYHDSTRCTGTEYQGEG